jgi:hypothetical protein
MMLDGDRSPWIHTAVMRLSASSVSAILVFACACAPGVSGKVDSGPGDDASPFDAPARADARPLPDNTSVYAHSATELFKVNPDTLAQTSVGIFTFAGEAENITDIAVDKGGDMVGISLQSVYAIDRETAVATQLSTLSGDSGLTSLSFVPTDINDASSDEILVAADFEGVVWDINPDTGLRTNLGNYNASGTTIGSSGDIVSIIGFGTVATVNVSGEDNDFLARINSDTWQATLLGDTGYDKIFGIGFWAGEVYGFTDNGDFVTLNAMTGAVTNVRTSSISWWGAGVTTIAPIVD